MTRTKKYLTATVLSVYGAIFIFAISARVISGVSTDLLTQTVRTSSEVIRNLSDFSEIEAVGDFSIEIYQGDAFEVDFSPLDGVSGDFKAGVEGGVLRLDGYGNEKGGQTAIVRVRLPNLIAVRANGMPEISIGGFRAPKLSLGLHRVDKLNLTSSQIEVLEIDATTGDVINLVDVETETRLIKTYGGRYSKTRIYEQ